MARREHMIQYRKEHFLSVLDMALKANTTKRVILMLEGSEGEHTVPGIAERVGKAYEMTELQTEMLMPEHYRKSSPNYNPDKFKYE